MMKLLRNNYDIDLISEKFLKLTGYFFTVTKDKWVLKFLTL